MKYEISYYDTAAERGLKDPAFYVWNGSDNVLTIDDGTNTASVDCVGEMRIHIPMVKVNPDGTTELSDDYIQINYCDDLVNEGIDTDFKLGWLSNLCERLDVELFHNNAWFEVYLNDDYDYADIHHDLDEAIAQAKAQLDEARVA